MVSLAIILAVCITSVLFDVAVGNSWRCRTKSFKQIQESETRFRKKEKRKLLSYLEKELKQHT